MTAATEGTVAADPAGRVLRRRSIRRWSLFAALAAVVAAADQATKAWVEATFQLGVPTEILGDLVRITKHYNTGGIFGLFGDSAVVLGLASLVVVAVIVLYQARDGMTGGPLLTVALGLLLGGALGNLIDRLRLQYVVDYVDAGLGTWRWYTFNVADAAISISIVLLIGLSLLGDRLPFAADAGIRDGDRDARPGRGAGDDGAGD